MGDSSDDFIMLRPDGLYMYSAADANSVKAKFRITRILTRSPRITLSTILKNKEKFKHLFATSKLKPGIKRCRLATYQDVEEALFSWFKQARCMNVPISGPIMKIKAKELALKMGHSEFQCSTGWLERLSPELLLSMLLLTVFVYCSFIRLKLC